MLAWDGERMTEDFTQVRQTIHQISFPLRDLPCPNPNVNISAAIKFRHTLIFLATKYVHGCFVRIATGFGENHTRIL
jgi:hypothetical protein